MTTNPCPQRAPRQDKASANRLEGGDSGRVLLAAVVEDRAGDNLRARPPRRRAAPRPRAGARPPRRAAPRARPAAPPPHSPQLVEVAHDDPPGRPARNVSSFPPT